MKRPIEIVSGIGVFATSLLTLMALCKMIFYHQQSVQKVALVSIVSLALTGLARWRIHSSFVGQQTKVAHYPVWNSWV